MELDPEWAENLCFGLDLWRGEWSGAMEQGVRGGIRSRTPRRKSRRKPGGPRRARVLATGTDRGGRGEGRLLSVEGAKMRVGRGEEN